MIIHPVPSDSSALHTVISGRVPRWFHAALAAFTTAMLVLARTRETTYVDLVQEDRLVEWLTFFLFLASAVMFGERASRLRRLGDACVAAFCFVAAGEEISWGQRIFGFTPAATFLAHNAQQEANVHNLIEPFGQPKWTFIGVLACYGLLAPALAQVPSLRRLADRFGLTIAPAPAAAWFAAAIAILVWYPVRFTGEWIETLGGALFLVASQIGSPRLAVTLGLTGVLSALATRASEHASARPELVACATTEVRALVDDIRADAGSRLILRDRQIHRRLYSLWRDRDLDSTAARRFRTATCPAPSDATVRRRFGVDPWGTAYWVRTSGDGPQRRVVVYSFGPNRRRDDIQGGGSAGDDIAAASALP